ncbi:MAG: LysM peptidoglycan-binding domain-containing protein [Verrucomicrobiota bacterium]|nr:LysM peptidoglycan-binding domain-containing protein [Verrucomicrobiota bacterium]
MKNIFYRLSFGILFLYPFFSWGNVQLANLKQDLELVSRELAGLRSEVELLRRENAQLRVVVDSFAKKANSDQGISSAQLIQINSRLSSLEKRVQANTSSQAMIQTSVNKQVQELIKQMNDGFEKVSKGTAAPPPTKTFSSDYPQKGFVHKVEKGETVSSIAKKYESKVKWIIDANQIEDPTKVFIGKELFVPQK